MGKSLAQRTAEAKQEGWHRYVRSENDERAMLAGYKFVPVFGEYVCEFFAKYLRHSKGQWAGKPFILADVQRDEIVMPLFSWVHEDSGLRRFRTADIWVAKKNFKSTLGAGLMLYGLTADDEDGAECYAAANDRSQAGIVFGEAANMVAASPQLRSELQVIRSAKRIVRSGSSWFQALSADAATAEGKNAHFRIFDEIHAANEQGRALFEALRYSGAARRQPLGIVISTAGDDTAGIGREQYEYADGVRKGLIEDITSFVYIAEAEPADDWTKPETWKKANPMLGVTISQDEMADECNKAVQSPRLKNSFLRYRLNIWTAAETSWLDTRRWADSVFDPDAVDLSAFPCTGAFDLSLRLDLTAWVRCHREDLEDGNARYYFVPHFWLPKAQIEDREREDRMAYRTLEEQGWITLTTGNEYAVDYAAVREFILGECARYGVSEIAYDRHNAWQFAQELDANRLTMVEIPQNYMGLSDSSKEFEMLVKEGRALHDGNPIMSWMVDRVRVLSDTNGNIRPVKCDKARRRTRIDGVVAAVMALSRSMLGGASKSYTGGGILV